MTPAQLQEHSTSSAGDMQGKWAGSEPALLPPAQPCALIHSSQAAFAGWELLDNARAAWASGRLSLRGQASSGLAVGLSPPGTAARHTFHGPACSGGENSSSMKH